MIKNEEKLQKALTTIRINDLMKEYSFEPKTCDTQKPTMILDSIDAAEIVCFYRKGTEQYRLIIDHETNKTYRIWWRHNTQTNEYEWVENTYVDTEEYHIHDPFTPQDLCVNTHITDQYRATHYTQYLDEALRYYWKLRGGAKAAVSNNLFQHTISEQIYTFIIHYHTNPHISALLPLLNDQTRLQLYENSGDLWDLYGSLNFNNKNTVLSILGVNGYQLNTPNAVRRAKEILKTNDVSYINNDTWNNFLEATTTVEGIEVLLNLSTDEQIKQQYQSRLAMLEDDGTYCICAPTCYDDLLDDDRVLKMFFIRSANVLSSLLKGKFEIYFLRKSNSPNVPWVKIMVKNNECCMAYGDGNKSLGYTDEYFDAVPFLVWWCDQHNIKYNKDVFTQRYNGHVFKGRDRAMPTESIEQYRMSKQTQQTTN